MFNYLTPIIYWALTAIWIGILWLCILKLFRRDFRDNLFSTILIILCIDALRTLLESVFFGASRTSALDMLPQNVHAFLSHPGLIFIPKAVNLIAAITIILLLLTKLFPQEKDERLKTERLAAELDRNTQSQDMVETALRESENRFRSIVDATPMGIHMYELNEDGELMLTGANPAADAILGINHEPLIGKTILEAFPALEYTEIPDRYKDACILGRPWKTEEIRYQGDAISGAFEIHAFRTQPECLIVQFLDITERKRTESNLEALNRNLEKLIEERTFDLRHKAEELKKANFRMEEVGRLKSALLSTVTHELRTPLTSIIGYTKLTGRDYTRDILPLVRGNTSLSRRGQRIKDNLDVIGLESSRLLGLIDNFLALSRIRSAIKEETKTRVNPGAIIKRSIDLSHSYFAAQQDIALEAHVNDELPSVFGDPDNLVQMVVNLLDNAAKFAGSGVVQLQCGLNGDHIEITVSDDGPGIPENERDKVFEAFHQVCEDAGCTDKPPGIGTGLTISKHIAENHGGDISLDCPESGGCTFTVTLPVDTAIKNE